MNEESEKFYNKILVLFTSIIILFVSFICFIFIGIAKVEAQDLYWVRPRNNAITNYVDPMAGSVISTTDSQVVGTLNNFTNNGNRLSPRFRINQNVVDSSITYLPKDTHYKIVLKGTFQVINSTTPNLSNAIRIYAATQEAYISAYCDGTSSVETSKLSDNSNRYNYTYTCTDFLVDRTDISFLAIVIHSSNVNFNYNYISSLSLYDITNEKDNESIINNQDKNTQEIIDNQDKNTQEIVDKQEQTNEKLEDINDSLLDSDTSSSSDSLDSFFGSFNNSDNGGLSAIITAPLVAINKTLDNSCPSLDGSYKGQSFSIPSGCVFWNRIPQVKELANIISGGFLCYLILRKIFLLIHQLKDPTDDRVEVMNL